MTYATPPMLSDSAAVRREGNALDADPATPSPKPPPHDVAMFDHTAAVGRVLDASGSTRPDR